MSNPTIGMVKCPFSGELGAVRKDKRGAFYFISVAGRLAPSADFGQEWFLEHATIWGDREPPADVPDWIVQGKSFPPATRSRIPGARKIPEGAVSVVNPQGTEETGADRPAAPIHDAPRPKPARNPWSLFGADDDA